MLKPLRVAVLCSRRCPGAADLLSDRARGRQAYAFAHQEWMLSAAWGPMWRAVLELVTSGRAVPEAVEEEWSGLRAEPAVAGKRR
jgi:hypothetical protein